MSDKSDTLISTGSFLVDRARALDKLMRFQMPDARMYLLPWAQAAAASGASRVCVTIQSGGLEFCFDGRPWRSQDVKDPYSWLFEDDPAGEHAAHRELAVGLLSALRLKPEHVSIAFSDGVAEHALYVKSVTDDHLESDLTVSPLSAASERCGMRVRMLIFLSLPLPGAFETELDYLQRATRYFPAEIQVNGKVINPIPPPAEARLRVAFSKDGVEGEAALSAKTVDISRVELLTYGVRVAVELVKLPSVQVSAWLRCDGLRKSISQAGIIKDERYEAAIELLKHETEKLLLNALREAGLLAPSVGKTLSDPREHARWMSWEKPDDSVARLSLVAAAARDTCLSRREELWKGDALLSILTQAPLFFDVQGHPLSLRVLEEQRRWLGGVPYLPHLSSSVPEGLAVAWAASPEDRRFLEEFYGAEARRLESFRLGAASVEVAPALAETNLLVKISFRSGPIVGEVGLSLSPHARHSHIRWLQSGHPHSVAVWPLGGLRLESVVDNPGIVHVPVPGDTHEEVAQSLAAIMAAAPSAYRKIASEYDPELEAPRQAMIREHLLDLAVKSWSPARKEWTAHSWLERAALFRDSKGRMLSMGDLREAAAKGERTLLRASPHPEKLQPMMQGYPDHLKALFEGSDLAQILRPQTPPRQETARPVSARLLDDPALRPPSEPVAEAKSPAKGRRAPSPPPRSEAPLVAPAREPAAEDLSAEGAFKGMLRELAVRKACPLGPGEIDALQFAESRGGSLLLGSRGDGWTLNLAHPLARKTEPAGGLEERLPYLVSIFYTAVNRALPELTDEQDVELQLALAEHLLSREERVKR